MPQPPGDTAEPEVKTAFPKEYWTANLTELFERSAYYAVASFVVIYLGQLGLGNWLLPDGQPGLVRLRQPHRDDRRRGQRQWANHPGRCAGYFTDRLRRFGHQALRLGHSTEDGRIAGHAGFRHLLHGDQHRLVAGAIHKLDLSNPFRSQLHLCRGRRLLRADLLRCALLLSRSRALRRGAAERVQGELFAAPRAYEYIGALSPKGQEGLFLGYANLPIAIGALTGGPVGALIFNEVMCAGSTKLPNGLLELDPVQNTIGWLILGGIGLLSAAMMWSFNIWLKRQIAAEKRA